jgi:hypothetical protein
LRPVAVPILVPVKASSHALSRYQAGIQCMVTEADFEYFENGADVQLYMHCVLTTQGQAEN